MAVQKYKGKYKTSYRVYYRNPITKKHEYISGFDNKLDAGVKNAEILRRIKKDPQSFAEKESSEVTTFEDLASLYLEKHKLADSSYKNTFLMIKNEILSHIGNIEVENLTKKDIDAMIDTWLEKGNKPSSIQRKYNITKAIINWGYEYEYIQTKPKDSNKRIIKLISLQDVNTDNKNISTEEIQQLLNVAGPAMKRVIILGIYTGARPGPSELLSIKWSDVDFKAKILSIKRAKKGGVKNTSIYISDNLYGYLLKWWEEDQGINCPTILHTKGKPMSRIDNWFFQILKKAGFNKKYAPYCLRHYFATQALSLGIDVKTISEILGNTPKMVLNTYAHVLDDNKKKAANIIPKF